MKFNIIALILVLIVIVSSQSGEEENFEEREMKEERYVRRNVKTFRLHPVGTCCPEPRSEEDDEDFALDDYDESCCQFHTYGFWATAAKVSNGGMLSKIQRQVKAGFNAIQFVVSSKVLPYFHLAGYSKSAGVLKDDESFIGASLGRSFMVRLMFFCIVEYKETNGKEGFQPEGNSAGLEPDEVIAKYSVFNDAEMETEEGVKVSTNVKWTPITRVEKELEDGETMKALTFKLNKTPEYIGEVRFSVMYSPKPVFEKASNLTRKSVLTPNSLKFSMSISNITYQSNESTGLAIGTLMITRKTIRKRLRTENNDDENIVEDEEGNEYEAPDAATEEQECVDVPSESNDNEKGGFFSFKRKIWRKRLNQTGGVTNLICGEVENEWQVDTETASRMGERDTEFEVRAMFFSIPERVTDFVWDPSIGAFDGAASVSFCVLLLVGVLLLLL